MDDVRVRKATVNDLDTLLQFEQGVIEAERPFDATLKMGEIFYYDLKALLTSDQAALVVAQKEEKIVGSGYARIEQSKPYHQHPCYAYLGFMYVLPEYRRKGINLK